MQNSNVLVRVNIFHFDSFLFVLNHGPLISYQKDWKCIALVYKLVFVAANFDRLNKNTMSLPFLTKEIKLFSSETLMKPMYKDDSLH